jgi:hypothetical protein
MRPRSDLQSVSLSLSLSQPDIKNMNKNQTHDDGTAESNPHMAELLAWWQTAGSCLKTVRADDGSLEEVVDPAALRASMAAAGLAREAEVEPEPVAAEAAAADLPRPLLRVLARRDGLLMSMDFCPLMFPEEAEPWRAARRRRIRNLERAFWRAVQEAVAAA